MYTYLYCSYSLVNGVCCSVAWYAMAGALDVEVSAYVMMFLLGSFVLYDAGVIRGDLCLAGRVVFTLSVTFRLAYGEI
jgi:hypothetical protein